MNNLHDLRILVTRPEPQGTELCARITAQGGQAFYLPTIIYAPPVDESAFHASISTLGEQDWLIFISPQAVFASIAAIRRQWPHLPNSVKFAAVGSGTAQALRAAGYLPDAWPEEDYGSEALLRLPPFQTLSGQKIAIIRGEGGRDILAKTCLARGAKLSEVIVYQRQMPAIDTSSYTDLLKQKNIDVIICTSGEGVQNLNKMFQENARELLHDVPLLVVSERIKLLAHDLGFQTIWVAQNAKHETLLAALAERRKNIWQIK